MRIKQRVLALGFCLAAVGCGAGDEAGTAFSDTWADGDRSLVATAFTDELSTTVVLESSRPDMFETATVIDGSVEGDLDGLVRRIDDRVLNRAVDDLVVHWGEGDAADRALVEAVGAALDVDVSALATPYGDLSRDPAGADDGSGSTFDPGPLSRPAGEFHTNPTGARVDEPTTRQPRQPRGPVSRNPR